MGFLRALFGGGSIEEKKRDQMLERLVNAAFPGGDSQTQQYVDAVFSALGGKISKEECLKLTRHARIVFTLKTSRCDIRATDKMRTSVGAENGA
jgi:hypothetical protein